MTFRHPIPQTEGGDEENWRALENYLGGEGPVSVLSLSSGEKLTWAECIELWGEVTPAGLQVDYDFNFDSSTDADGWTSSVAARYDAGDQRLEFTNTQDYHYRTDVGTFLDNARISLDFTFIQGTSAIDGNWAGAFFVDNVGSPTDNILGIEIRAIGDGTSEVFLRHGNSFDYVSLATGVALVLGTTYRLKVTRSGHDVEYEISVVSGGAIVLSGTTTVPVPDQAQFGAAVTLDGVAFSEAAGGGVGGRYTYIDNIQLYSEQSEKRELKVRVIPASGGSAVTKTIFGMQGPTTQLTDF